MNVHSASLTCIASHVKHAPRAGRGASSVQIARITLSLSIVGMDGMAFDCAAIQADPMHIVIRCIALHPT